jgi:exopolysaccharide biosynthesis predicted pyruvyltransferase EpsI
LQTAGALVIQGPCTLSDDSNGLHRLHEDLWAMRADRLIFFSRDRESARLASSELPSGVEQFLNEDTAFYLDRDTVLKWSGPTRRRLDLLAVREDSEAVSVSEHQPGSAAVIDPAYFARTFDHWIRIHAASRTIVTNRTHSAVCGAILGVPTTLFPGAYHKNRSIWEFSLEPRGVKWTAEPVAGRSQVDPLLSWIPVPAIRRSWKLDRLAKGLRGIPLS